MLFISITTFGFITFGTVALYWLFFRPQSATAERLQEIGKGTARFSPVSSLAIEDSPVTAFAEKVAAPLQKLVPPSPQEADKLQRQLMQAGYRSPSASMIYRAIQLISIFGLPGIVLLSCIILARPISSAILWVMLAVVVGYALPRFILTRIIKKRKLLITWGLADALDLMVVSIEAGLGLNAAMVRVSDELKEVHPDLSDEFELANLEMRVGRERDEALRNLAERTGVDDLRSFVAMLIQADRFGTSIAQAVRAYSDSLRTRRRQRAEQAAQKAAVKLLFPLTVFLFPTLFMIALGPAVLKILDVLINN